MMDFIERLRAKPEHVRQRIAFGASAGITGVVATGWLMTLLVSGTFSIAPSPAKSSDAAIATTNEAARNVADSANQIHTGFQQLMGAVGAASTTAAAAPTLTVTDAGSSSTLDAKQSGSTAADQTVIHF
jgi:hypothetical protein